MTGPTGPEGPVGPTGPTAADVNDNTDRMHIAAYGDPRVNMAGTFTDPNDNSFAFQLGSQEFLRGVTTEMMNYPVRFMTQLPIAPAGTSPTVLGPLDCITSDPVKAATAWNLVMAERIGQAMGVLRAKEPPQLSSLPDSTV
jgi:hypothetical protein